MDARDRIQNESLGFGLRLYVDAVARNSSENLLFSPYSISLTMTNILLGSKGNTAEEIASALGFKDVDETGIHSKISRALSLIKQSGSNTNINIANNLFADVSFPFVSDFVDKGAKFYQNEITLLDIKKDPEESRKFINAWVAKMTNENIKDLLPSGSVSRESPLVVANAIYFKGCWLDQFDPRSTESMDFHTKEDQSCKAEMMIRKGRYKTKSDQGLGVHVVELPYENRDVSLILLVPKERFGLHNFERGLTSERLQELISNLKEEEVVIGLPKMKLEVKFDNLIKTLQAMGVKDAFDQGRANLKGISSTSGLFISTMAHKAFLEVNEEGSEAAAATAAVVNFSMSLIPPTTVVCDHPFMFLIKHNVTETILFVGRFTSPK